MKKYFWSLCVCFFSLLCLLSCGLEGFYYIDFIPESFYADTTRATVDLPSSSNDGYGTNGSYFDKFVIFYRIYISAWDYARRIETAQELDSVNSALRSDYVAFSPYTNTVSSTAAPSNLENTFFTRNYFYITLEDENIDDVLNRNSLGKTLEIFFPANGSKPTLKLNPDDKEYFLQRAQIGSSSFIPRPDRSFFNHPDMYNPANATSSINADVVANGQAGGSNTYVSMYIAAVGQSLEIPPRIIYSQPTFIGIFQLVNES